jgi:hypothetical protein
MYLAMGLEVLVAVKCGGTATVAVLPCLSDEEEEQPVRVRTNDARKSEPSRMDFMIAELRRDESERDI